MIRVVVPFNPNGVNVESGPVKVMFPLLFTYTEVKLNPKKLPAKPTGTNGVELSSLAPSTLVEKPGRLRRGLPKAETAVRATNPTTAARRTGLRPILIG
jgi:hypothetical protein